MRNASNAVVLRFLAQCLAGVLACASILDAGAEPSAAVNFAAGAKAPGGVITVVEYYNAGLQHYFITADPAEAAVLDGGAFGGAWVRTGASFPAWDIAGAPAGTVPVCRFFGTDRYRSDGSRIGPNSHFYTADPAECAYVRTAYQSVASDGRSYPAWTYESDAFAVKALVGGACPAGTQPLYRTYNNGMRGDPGHRYSLDPAVLQAMSGWLFEGLVMCLPPADGPLVTAQGTPTAGAVSATIGPGGGTLSAADGKLVVTIPAGALAGPTTIGIQPITNFAPGAIGSAYRLTPDGQVFAVPATLTWTYTDANLAGTAAASFGGAFQRAEGTWQWFGPASVDVAGRTVSVTTLHFTDVSLVKGVQIRPPSKTVKPGGSVALHVKACYQNPTDDLVFLVGYPCDVDQGPDGILTIDQWSVNGVIGGGGVFGSVLGNGSAATYSAPSVEPTPNVVTVSARVRVVGQGGFFQVASIITIAEDAWVGTATGVNGDVTTVASVTWTLESRVNNVAVYRGTGTATSSVTGGACAGGTFSPPTNPIDSAISATSLTVDFNATPPTYHGSGLTLWSASLNCPSGSGPSIAGGPWFGGPGSAGEASGSVSPDGTTIQGSAADSQSPPATFTWKFTRTP